MGISIKNPETERKARELARRRRSTLTAALDDALEQALKGERAAAPRRRTLAEIQAATDRFRKATGLDQHPPIPISKAEWDALDAYMRWGKGFHRAGLNMGDGFAYALAKALDAPLLYKGDDFPLTDVRSALA